jgi:CelD/BcsL family acetyltransferase involved in cellulose biosynthesis
MTISVQIAAPAAAAVAEVVPLNDIPSSWDAAWIDLAANASEPNPFAECWFMRPAVRHLHTNANDRMIGVWRDGVLLGLMPVTAAKRYGRLPIRHAENWVHYHCFFGTPLVRAGAEVAFWQAVLRLLDEADWAANFLHIVGIDPTGPVLAGLQATRQADIVHRSERAMLRSDLAPAAYYEAHVRQKKRKEIRRLRSRLDELGIVEFNKLASSDPVDNWIHDFLALEASGWKGREGSALNDDPATQKFFTEAMSGAHRAGKLEMLRLMLDEKPIAMLVNFMTPPGAYAFKIAFDEDYARFSPGVLIKIENLKTLDRSDIDWTDSCAVEDHPMINSLWAERREIVRVTVPLAGARRKAVFNAARGLEMLAAKVRGKR